MPKQAHDVMRLYDFLNTSHQVLYMWTKVAFTLRSWGPEKKVKRGPGHTEQEPFAQVFGKRETNRETERESEREGKCQPWAGL